MTSSVVPPVKKREEKHWRECYSAARPNRWIFDCVSELAAGLKREPRVLEAAGDVRSPDTIPNVIEAVVEEIARQFHGLSIYACAMWKEGKDRMVTTQAMHLPDPCPDAHQGRHAAMQHFAHYALGYGGISGGLEPEIAYPMPWPDFDMGARPALPPRHPNWEQEKSNIVDWFEKLWCWEGAYDSLDWAVIVADINAGTFEYFDKHRLPTEYTRGNDRRELAEPAQWDEETTAIWSNHIRSTMDVWGRVELSRTDTALQFRRVDLQLEPKIYETFLLEAAGCSGLDWKTPALLFEKRVKCAMEATPARDREERASALYDPAVPLVAEIGDRVRGLDSLLKKLREYESRISANVATIPSAERLTDWHPAAVQVSRTLETFADNADITKHIFPPQFSSRLVSSHYRWDVTGLRDWIELKPFWDGEAKMLRGGTTGIAVAFFAILHYALNIARVMPKTQEDAERLFDQEETVYGWPDFRTLDRCVEAVAQQLEECAISEWAGLRLTGSDLEDRYSAWSPKVWVRRNSDSEDEEARFTKSRPSFNVFLADADSYMDSPGPTPTGTPRESTRVTPEAAGAASSVAGATPTGEGGVAEQTDVPMNDPEPGPNSNVVGQEPVDSRAADIQNGDAPLSEFGGATTSTPRGEGQARQAVVSGTAIQGQEARTAESPIARKTPAPSRDLQPTKPVSEQPPATPAPAMPSLPVDNPSTTKLWKFSERLRAASTGVQQQAQKAASSTTADASSRSSENGAGSSANASRKCARAKVSTESAAPETSKKAK